MFSRYQQAQEYLKKAKETQQAIVVRSAVLFVRDEIVLSLLLCPAATYHGSVLVGFEYFTHAGPHLSAVGISSAHGPCTVIKTRAPDSDDAHLLYILPFYSKPYFL